MAFSVYDVQNQYITLIKSNVTDPNDERNAAGLEWVYDDVPITNNPAKYPRISVLAPANSSEQHELNSNKHRVTVRIEVQIRVKRSRTFDGKTPQVFADDLADEVIGALRADASINALRTNAGVFQVVLEADNIVSGEEVIIRQLIYRNVMAR